MSGAKIVVLYPQPKDEAAFEKAYLGQHIPMAVAKLDGKTKMVASKMMRGPDGSKAQQCCAPTTGARYVPRAAFRRV